MPSEQSYPPEDFSQFLVVCDASSAPLLHGLVGDGGVSGCEQHYLSFCQGGSAWSNIPGHLGGRVPLRVLS